MPSVHAPQHLDVPGGRLAYEAAGEGTPILFLHAAIADRRQWNREFEALSSSTRVVRVDTRGLGASTPATAPYSDMSDLASLVQHLKLPPAIVVGCSNGGRAAIDFALEHPKHVRGLLLLSPGVSGWSPELDPQGQPTYEADMARSAPIAAAWKAGQKDEAIRLLYDYWCSATSGTNASLARTMMHDNAQEIFTDASASHNQPIARPAIDRLEEIRVPTTILQGDQDEPTCVYIVRHAAEGIPDARFARVPNGDHMLNLSQPAVFDRALDELRR
jgi:3-oxoadipate enol-lactonase